MYCPYCKEELNYWNNELYCKVGKSLFSKHLEQIFVERIDTSEKLELSGFEPEDFEEGHFFCVNCSNRMSKIEQMHEICRSCGFEINKAMYFEIIELNPHSSC